MYITIESTKTLVHFTYKVLECKDNSDLFFIYVLTGQNNTSDFKYIGTYSLKSGFKYGKKSRIQVLLELHLYSQEKMV